MKTKEKGFNAVEIMLDKERKDCMHKAVSAALAACDNIYMAQPYKDLLEEIEASRFCLVLTSNSGILECLQYALYADGRIDEFSIANNLANEIKRADEQGSMCKKHDHIVVTLSLANKISTRLRNY